MKRIISFTVVFLIAVCALLAALPAMAETPQGNAVKNESDFLAMDKDGEYYLANNITISASYANSFAGILDGNGYKIKIADGANVSPFKKIEGATFKDLTVEGVINVKSKTSYGGIATEGYGDFDNVITRVGISAMVEDSFNSVGVPLGGFIAKATGECNFYQCKNQASITVITENGSAPTAGRTGFGGFIGNAEASGNKISFVECSNDALITSLEGRINLGGFVGTSLNTDLSFVSCENNAIIAGQTGSSDSYHCGNGGFVGVMNGYSLTVKDSKNTADVQTNGGYGHTGGCVGRFINVLNVEIDGFVNMHAINNPSNVWEGVGGVVGFMGDRSASYAGTYIFKDCVNLGWVNGSMAGGIVGIDYGVHGVDMRFERCVNMSSVKTLGAAYSGGILGRTNSNLRSLTVTKCLNAGTISTSAGAYGVGGIVGNIGADGISYSYTPVFEYCVNTGNIICTTTVNTAGNVVAAGILARNIYMPTTIRNCVNLGELSNSCVSSNIAPMAPKYNSINHSVSGCSYLSGTGSSIWGESAKSLESLRADVVSALTSGLDDANEYYNYEDGVGQGVDAVLCATTVAEVANGAKQIIVNIDGLVLISEIRMELLAELGDAIENNGNKYTDESYSKYISAYEKIKNDINSADASNINSFDVPSLKADAESVLVLLVDAKKAEFLEALGDAIDNSNGRYTENSYAEYLADYNKLKNDINSIKNIDDINAIDVSKSKTEAENKLVLSIDDKKAQLLAALDEAIDNSNNIYSDESYAEYLAEYEKIKNSIISAENLEDIEKIDVSSLKEAAEEKLALVIDVKKAEYLEALGEMLTNDDGIYTDESYEKYSSAYLAVKAIIDNAKDSATLDSLEIEILKTSAEANLELVKDPIDIETDRAELIALLGNKKLNASNIYTAESYAKYSNAYDAIKAMINGAADKATLDNIDVVALKSAAEGALALVEAPIDIETDRAELIALLGNKKSNASNVYTAESYAKYSNAYDAIRVMINSATDKATLDNIDVEALKSAAEGALVLVEVPIDIETDRAELIALLGNKKSNASNVYTAESYAKYSNAYDAIKAMINSATDKATLDNIDVEALKSAVEGALTLVEFESDRAELIAILGDKKSNASNIYTAESYAKYSNAYDAIKVMINGATDKATLDNIDVVALKSAAEGSLALVENSDSEKDPENNDGSGTGTAPDSDSSQNGENGENSGTDEGDLTDGTNTATDESKTEINADKDVGCASTMAISALCVVSAMGMALVVKKKDNY